MGHTGRGPWGSSDGPPESRPHFNISEPSPIGEAKPFDDPYFASVDNTQSADLDLSQFEGMTEGNWKDNAHACGEYYGNIEADLGNQRIRTIAVVLKYATHEEQVANARAIAAVPSLIAEVKRLRDACEAKTNLLAEQQCELTEVNIANATLRADVERLTRERAELEAEEDSARDARQSREEKLMNALQKQEDRIAELERDREALREENNRLSMELTAVTNPPDGNAL